MCRLSGARPEGSAPSSSGRLTGLRTEPSGSGRLRFISNSWSSSILAPAHAPGAGAQLRRDRRPGARAPTRSILPRVLRPLLLPAAARVLRPATLCAYLRPSNIDSSRHTRAILSLLVQRFRRTWPGVRVVLRGDSAFCRRRMLDGCDRHEVGYIVGLAPNAALERKVAVACEVAKRSFETAGRKSGCSPRSPRAAGDSAGRASPASSTDQRGKTRASS